MADVDRRLRKLEERTAADADFDAAIEEIRKRTGDLLSSPQVLAMPSLTPAEEAQATAKVKALLENLRRNA